MNSYTRIDSPIGRLLLGTDGKALFEGIVEALT